MADRTRPYAEIRNRRLTRVSDATGRLITRTVTIPGLTNADGSPFTVDTTMDIQEIGYDTVSGIIDFDYSTEPQIFGNHPHAIGPLREWLPDAYPLPEYPQHREGAFRALASMMARHDLGGVIVRPDVEGRTLEIHPPRFAQIQGIGTDEYRRQAWFACIREYLPFQADIWWDDAHDVARVRPSRKGNSD